VSLLSDSKLLSCDTWPTFTLTMCEDLPFGLVRRFVGKYLLLNLKLNLNPSLKLKLDLNLESLRVPNYKKQRSTHLGR